MEYHEDLQSADPVFTAKTPQVQRAVKLHKKSERTKTGNFLIEGENAISEALNSAPPEQMHDFFVQKSSVNRFAELIQKAKDNGVFVHVIDEKAAQALSETTSTAGLFAVMSHVAQQWENSQNTEESTRLPLVILAVETTEPGNAGALIRIGDAVGAEEIIFSGASVDPHNGKSVRASAGSIFHLPVSYASDTAEVIESFQSRGYQVLATALDADFLLNEIPDEAVTPSEISLSQPTVWMFGNEAHGLGGWAESADAKVRIPIFGEAESFNLATAAAICLYQSAQVLDSKRSATP